MSDQEVKELQEELEVEVSEPKSKKKKHREEVVEVELTNVRDQELPAEEHEELAEPEHLQEEVVEVHVAVEVAPLPVEGPVEVKEDNSPKAPLRMQTAKKLHTIIKEHGQKGTAKYFPSRTRH